MGIYGLLQAGILANKLLKERIGKHGYYKVQHTHVLFKHITKDIQFTLVVDDFGVKCIGKENAMHLLNKINKYYPGCADDWDGSQYCGITLNWNYIHQTIDLSMPGYVIRQLLKYKYEKTKRDQHSPYQAPIKHYSKDAQNLLVKRVQKVVGSIL